MISATKINRKLRKMAGWNVVCAILLRGRATIRHSRISAVSLISISFISDFLPCSPLIPIRSSPLPPRQAEAGSASCAFRLGERGKRRRAR
ncbi:hypothetical protein X963_5371 [Burkholderia pseudomallei MSHR7498]|nr:hypothetical protein X963_5371 [Burkholderia pseudomallei MSHR7498]